VSERRTIEEILAEARARLDRVEAAALADEVAAGALLVDIRPAEQRQRDGELPGAIVIDRNVLEWRLDPASPNAIAQVGYEHRVIIVCNEGYSSSLAAAMLQDIGVARATDLAGGFQEWMRVTRA
jgi:rhodanese-related sulfurtransferase